MATAQISLPEKLDSKKPKDWKRWKERLECYRIAAGLNDKDDKVQISTLVYAMGGSANDILKSFHISEKHCLRDSYSIIHIAFFGAIESYLRTSSF